MKKLIMILPLALIFCFMVGCQDKEAMAELEEFRAQAAVEEQNNALITRYLKEVSEGDMEAMKGIFSPDFVFHSPGQDIFLEEVIEAKRQQKIMFPDITILVGDKIFKGNKAILRIIARGTHTGEVEGFPATGNKIEVEAIEIVQIANGKIAEIWEVMDSLGLNLQLGMELKPKEEEK